MDILLKKKVERVQEILDEVAVNKRWTRAQYREFLEEVGSGIDASLEALADDERRERGDG
jgi:hypothetical protein